jgi:hypothetical protein
MEKKKPLTITVYFIVLVLDIAMLALGYVGEVKMIDKRVAWISSFIVFFILFVFIWITFMQSGKNTFGANLSYWVFLVNLHFANQLSN